MVVEVLFIAGVQVPVILLFDTEGSLNESPKHIELTGVKVGLTEAFTLTVMVVVEAHCPAVGVNV